MSSQGQSTIFPRQLITDVGLEEARELLRHLEIRKRINPLEFFKSLHFQRQFEECPAKIKGVFGGNRAGKTQVGAKYIIEKCLAKPKQRWWAVSETEEVSINIQQRKIWEILPKLEMKYCHYDEINGFRNGKITFKNGSMIRFKTYKQGREAFQADDLDGIWNDEEPPYDIYREQRMRLIDRDGEMIFTLTALKGVTELISELYDDHSVVEAQRSEILEEDLPRIIEKNSAMFFMLWTTENPHISQERLSKDIQVMERSEIRSRIHGIPTNMAGRIYPTFTKVIHVCSWDMVPKRLVTLYHMLDPHDRKPWAMCWIAVDKTNTAYVIREYPWRKNFNDMDSDDKTYDDYVKVIRATEEELLDIYGRSVHKRIIDPNFGHKTVQLAERKDGNSKTSPVKELRSRGLKFEDGLDALEAGHLQVRKMLRWEKKDGELIVQPRLMVLDDCENTVRHMSKYSWKDLDQSDGDVKAKPQITQKWKDFADLIRYGSMAGLVYVDTRQRDMPETERRY